MIRGGLGFPVSNEILNSMVKDYSFKSPGGSSGTYYAGGFYDAPDFGTSLSSIGATTTHVAANDAHAAHAFIVAKIAGTVDTGQVGLKVTGTRVQDDGTRTPGYTDILTDDITSLGSNTYLEGVKFIGTITFQLYIVSGTPTTMSLLFNYGICKYDDIGNRKFTVTDLEVTGRSGATDSSFNVGIIHHKNTGWLYHISAFIPGPGFAADMNTDYITEKNITNSEYFSWKRSGGIVEVAGDLAEGFIFKIITSANNSIESMNLHLVARF